MGNEYSGMGHRVWGTWAMGHRGIGYRGMEHM